MKIFIGSDHAGFTLKEKLVPFLKFRGHDVFDLGAKKYDKDDDYPDFISQVAHSVAGEIDSAGIVIGGSGQGEGMAANREHYARAAVYYGGPLDVIKVSREHNNANILSLGARFITENEARDAVEVFLNTAFSREARHIRRIKKITARKF